MKKILVLGAGLSASSLIKYLIDNATEHQWHIRVADLSLEMAQKKIGKHPQAQALAIDIHQSAELDNQVAWADLVISMLPASFHPRVANSCLQHGRHMLTASYVSDQVKQLDAQVRQAGLLFLNELGVDPGIDHMSAMQLIDEIRQDGGRITGFRSYTGGLVAPKHDNNPWNYKFTWNPRNVVLAGQGVAKVSVQGRIKHIPYHQLFKRTERIEVEGYGEFEAYSNRDSLKYIPIYGLENIPTMIRGTLRRPGFARAWNTLVQLGLTDDSYTIENSEQLTYRDFLNTFLPFSLEVPIEEKLRRYLQLPEDSDLLYKLRWLGIFERRRIGLANASPARILQKLLEEKWKFEADDRDMIVMQHIFDYELGDSQRRIVSSLVVEGQDQVHTAMAITVGIPVAIAAKLLLTGQIQATGVHIPITQAIYEPILRELKNYGIRFSEQRSEHR